MTRRIHPGLPAVVAACLTSISAFAHAADPADQVPAAQTQPVAAAARPGAGGIEDPNLVLAARYGQKDTVLLLLGQGVDINSRERLGRTPLIAAAGENRTEIITLLIKRGADIAARDVDGGTALINACARGYLESARLLVEAGAEVDARDNNGITALIAAIKSGHSKVVEYLLARGADPNGSVSKDYTPLMYAVAAGIPMQESLNIVHQLLEKGAEPNVARKAGVTALTLAQRNGQDRSAEELRNYGARDDSPYADLNPESALIKAIKREDAAKVEELLADGVNVNYRDPITGVTPLLSAAYYGNANIMELLLGHDVEVNDVPWGLSEQRIETYSAPLKERELMRVASAGDTALLTSIRRGDRNMVQVLLVHGANIRLPNRSGETPAIRCIRQGEASLLRALLTEGLDPNAVEASVSRGYMISNLVNNGKPPVLLIEAVKSGHADISQALLEAGAMPDVTDNEGKSALYWAVAGNHEDMVQELLARGADVNPCDKAGITPLMVAAREGYDRITELLLQHGAQVNVLDNDGSDGRDGGKTALIYAAEGGHAAIVNLLLRHGADAQLSADNGERAVDVAQMKGYADVVTLLTAVSPE